MTDNFQEFSSSDYAWVKVNRCSWWPAQVVDEATISKKRIPKRKAPDGVLVRLYGTYHYLYVDIQKCCSEFKDVLRQNNSCARAEFEKAIEKLIHGTHKSDNPGKDTQGLEGVNHMEINGQAETGTMSSKQKRRKAKSTTEEKANPPDQSNAKKRKSAGNDAEDPPKIKKSKSEKDQTLGNHEKSKQRKNSNNEALGQDGKVAKRLKGGSTKKKEKGGAEVQRPIQKKTLEKVKVKITLKDNASTPKKKMDSATKDSKTKKQKKEVQTSKMQISNGKSHLVKTKGEMSKGSAKNKKQIKDSEPGTSHRQKKVLEPSTDDPAVTKSPSKRKKSKGDGKSAEANCIDSAKSPDTMRRIKVMQNLGLIAPCGSPFRNGLTTNK